MQDVKVIFKDTKGNSLTSAQLPDVPRIGEIVWFADGSGGGVVQVEWLLYPSEPLVSVTLNPIQDP